MHGYLCIDNYSNHQNKALKTGSKVGFGEKGLVSSELTFHPDETSCSGEDLRNNYSQLTTLPFTNCKLSMSLHRQLHRKLVLAFVQTSNYSFSHRLARDLERFRVSFRQ